MARSVNGFRYRFRYACWSLWGSSARGGGAQSAAEVVVPGVVITQSVGVPVDVDHHGSVQEAIEKCCSDGGIAKNLPPRSHRPIGCHDDRRLQVPLIDDLEQSGRGLAGQRKIAELINYQARRSGVEPHR